MFWDGKMDAGLVVDECEDVGGRGVVGGLLREQVDGDEKRDRGRGDSTNGA